MEIDLRHYYLFEFDLQADKLATKLIKRVAQTSKDNVDLETEEEEKKREIEKCIKKNLEHFKKFRTVPSFPAKPKKIILKDGKNILKLIIEN